MGSSPILSDMICETCGKEHDGSYGSGRFCSFSCKQKFASKDAIKKSAQTIKAKYGIKCKCDHCGKSFLSKKELRTHLPHCEKRIRFGSLKHGNWKCEVCEDVFETRRKLCSHKKEQGHYTYKGASRIENGFCKFCERKFSTINAISFHEKHCLKNPNRISYKGHRHSDETRKKLSEHMKKLHAEGNAFSWADLSKRKEPSWPEKWFIEALKNEFGYLENKDYEREIKFYTFSLDFVFPGKKVIEIDGSQHKRSEYQKDCDRRKDEKLKQDGWKELRIDWDECFKNPKETLQSVKAFLEIS